VRAAVSQGIVHYLLKPFAFAALRDKLERYRQYRTQIARSESATDQSEVDGLLATLRGQSPTHLPKGMSPESLAAVADLIRAAPGGLSAAEVARSLQASRVTARRYLEYLAERGAAARHLRYGSGAGRPEVEYRWIP